MRHNGTSSLVEERMHRERKTPSKVCQQRWDDHTKKVHAEKLRNIKPSIDNSPPKTQTHLENRRKRDQINEGIYQI